MKCQVVIAEDYSVSKQEEEEDQVVTVTNEHDYVEVPPEGGFAQVGVEVVFVYFVFLQAAKRPRLMDEEVVEYVQEELERKPVVQVLQ